VNYDALVVVSFGGPEGPDDVMPFLRQVTRGRNVPDARLEVVAQQYQRFGGVSPINAHTRALVEAVRAVVGLPVYWGNRNCHPFLADTVRAMRDDGVERALAFVTSAFGSYSGCRQYLEDIEAARAAVGDDAPVVDKLRLYYNHPGFIDTMAENVRSVLERVPVGSPLVFTAHSIPLASAEQSPYVTQLREASALVASRAAPERQWSLVFQSRSGAPGQAWLEPDVSDHLRELARTGAPGAVLVPIGFTSDHMEVIYDLDVLAAETASELKLPLTRAATVGVGRRFVEMVRELVEERLDPAAPRLWLGTQGPWPDTCPAGCCLG